MPFLLNHRGLISASSFGFYVLVFFLSYEKLGGASISFSIIPVIISGWFLGLYGGVIAGVLSYPLDAALFYLVDYPDWQTVIARGAVGHLMLVAIGTSSGWVSNLFNREKTQAEELENERAQLTELVSELKRSDAVLQESETRYRQIVESTSDIVYVINKEGIIEYINSPAATLTGYTMEELFGTNIEQLICPDWKDKVLDYYEKQINEQISSTKFELPIMAKNGCTVWIEQNTNLLLKEGKVIGLQSIARDVTERKKTQKTLASAHDKAVAASKFKSQLLANVSHELRTPLNAIMGYAEILQSGRLDSLSESQNDMLSRVISSTEQMATLVNNLLDQAQIEGGKLKLREELFPLDKLLNNVENVLSILAVTKSISFSCSIDEDVPQYLLGDYQRLHQVLMNLANNAIKFTQEGSVKVTISMHNSSQWKMQVSDTGQGISVEAQGYIFDAFRQADDSTTRKFYGAGLGLSIVKELIKQMNGDLHLESQPGKGSTFTVLLPLLEIPKVVT